MKPVDDANSTVEYIGENGDIMIVNPHKQGKDSRRIYSFNKVFGANVTQRRFPLSHLVFCWILTIARQHVTSSISLFNFLMSDTVVNGKDAMISDESNISLVCHVFLVNISVCCLHYMRST